MTYRSIFTHKANLITNDEQVYIPNETSGFVLLSPYSRRADKDEETWMAWRSLKKIPHRKKKVGNKNSSCSTEIFP